MAVAGVRIIGRADLPGRRRQLGGTAQAHLPVLRDILRRPDLAQDLHRRQLRQLRLFLGSVNRTVQSSAVDADRGGQILARRLGLGQPVVLYPPAIRYQVLYRHNGGSEHTPGFPTSIDVELGSTKEPVAK